MNQYTGFARVYDAFMAKEIPYDKWADFIEKELPEKNTPVLDLGCGTGNITLRLAAKGFDMIGADISHEMLAEAQAKAHDTNAQILWLAQDMRRLDLYGTVGAVCSCCDGINYLLKDDEVKEVFRRVRLFLEKDGVFIFDMNTRFKFETVLGNRTFGDSANNAAYEWDNHYEPLTQINTYRVTFEADGEVFQELHRQRAYDPAVITNWLLEAGFGAVALRDNYTSEAPGVYCTRVVFVCR